MATMGPDRPSSALEHESEGRAEVRGNTGMDDTRGCQLDLDKGHIITDSEEEEKTEDSLISKKMQECNLKTQYAIKIDTTCSQKEQKKGPWWLQ